MKPQIIPKCLNIVVALNCEGSPLIDHFKLKKADSRAFDLYQSSTEINVNLVVAGIGQLNCAAAVAWLAAKTDSFDCVWLNVGTAGHLSHAIGEVALVHCSKEEGSSRHYFPPLVAAWSGKSISLLSCSSPQNNYPQSDAVDMEARAYYRTALKFSSAELVQSVKVISDNQQCGVENLNARKITDLIRAQVAAIGGFAQALLGLLETRNAVQLPVEDIAHLHCTVSQDRQFRELVHRHQVLASFDDNLREGIRNCRSMSQVIGFLTKELSSRAPRTMSDLG